MLSIRELQSDSDIQSAFDLMHTLRNRIRSETFLREVRHQQASGYRLVGGFHDRRLVALAGIRSSATISRGPHLFVDDLVVEPSEQKRGHGREMIEWLRADAKRLGHEKLWLDSRDTAVGFYQRVGFTMTTGVPGWIAAG